MPKNKRMRLPNGFGQISQIKNARLRKPFRAMVTVGKTETGKPICRLLKPVAYFSTYNEAYAALLEYNKKPYCLTGDMTGDELFEEWYRVKEKEGATDVNLRDTRRSWKYCSILYNMRVTDIRAQHIRECIENGEAIIQGKPNKPKPLQQRKIKTVLNQLFDYALSYDLVDKNYARNYQMPKNITQELSEVAMSHISFTDEELTKLWKGSTYNTCIQMMLIQCYSGWRPQELINMKISDVDLENWAFTGGMKTEAGKNRVVPIHSKIQKLVKYNYDQALDRHCEYLFSREDGRTGRIIPYTYDRLYEDFKYIITAKKLNPNHRPHDGRKQFVTMCNRYEVNEYAIKKFVGHKITDVTERVYTDRSFDWYREQIEKIK